MTGHDGTPAGGDGSDTGVTGPVHLSPDGTMNFQKQNGVWYQAPIATPTQWTKVDPSTMMGTVSFITILDQKFPNG